MLRELSIHLCFYHLQYCYIAWTLVDIMIAKHTFNGHWMKMSIVFVLFYLHIWFSFFVDFKLTMSFMLVMWSILFLCKLLSVCIYDLLLFNQICFTCNFLMVGYPSEFYPESLWFYVRYQRGSKNNTMTGLVGLIFFSKAA